MKDFALVLLLVLVIGGSFYLKDREIQQSKARIEALEKGLSAAKATATGWQIAAQTQGIAANAQADLAAACVKREAKAQSDLAAIADIMAGTIPTEITPEQIRQGVDDATRQRAADMLNRPL